MRWVYALGAMKTGRKVSRLLWLAVLAGSACTTARAPPLEAGSGTGAGTSTSNQTGGGTSSGGSSTTGSASTTGGSTAATGGSTSATGGSGSTTSGTTGMADAGCSDLVRYRQFEEFFPCQTNADCRCPFLCTTDPGLNYVGPGLACEQTCSTTADCRDPATHCIGGFCNLNVCNGFDPDAGDSWKGSQPCPGLDAGDGTCVPDVFASSEGYQFDCVRPGVSTSICFGPSPASIPATTCAAGMLCTYQDAPAFPPNSSGGYAAPWTEFPGSCALICDPTGAAPPGCPPGFRCQSNFFVHWYCPRCTGWCVPSGDAGISGPPWLIDYQFCDGYVCAPPLSCIATDPLGSICRGACTTSGDCPTPGEFCDGGLCELPLCVVPLPDGGASSQSTDQLCNVQTPGDGTCLPLATFPPVAGCYLGGTATTTCVPFSSRLEETCPAGQTCVGGSCYPVCNPGNGPCSGGTACVALGHGGAGAIGICTGQCLPAGYQCADLCSDQCGDFNGDCCSGQCVASDGDAWVCN